MPTAEQTATRLQRVIAVAALALLGSTWRLWTPDTGFPQIPWFSWACRLPAPVDRVALAGLVASCLVLLLAGSNSPWRRRGLCLFAVSLMLLLLPSQQRLQPWAWEFLLIAVILAVAPAEQTLRLLRWLVAGIYIHSALSKVDVSFFDDHGELLLGGLLNALGLGNEFWTERARLFAIGFFPAGELVIGIGLLVPALRRWALRGSYLMHALLLLTLGPLGLDHKPGVLIWNVFFIAQNRLLFRTALVTGEIQPDTDTNAAQAGNSGRRVIATGIVVVATLCPLLQNLGWFDAWPSWAVYSARPSLVAVMVAENRVEDLPPGLQEFVGPPQPLTEWRPLNLDSWSFATLNCPIYPEERFRIAVIRAWATEGELGDDIQVDVRGAPNRWTGRREATEIAGVEDLQSFAERYRLNTTPRD